MMSGKRSVGSFDPRLSTLSGRACQPATPAARPAADSVTKPEPDALHKVGWYVTAYGLSPGGSGGSSRIKVIVTRRFAAKVGSSGNNGCVSAFPDTPKM